MTTVRFNMAFAVWILHLVMLPFYLFRSGSVQPAHLVFALAVMAAAITPAAFYVAADALELRRRYCLAGHFSQAGVLLALYVFYTFIVNGIWAAVLGSAQPLLFSLFGLYNLFVFAFCGWFVCQAPLEFSRYTRAGLFLALLIVLVDVTFAGGASSEQRVEGLFNNPNQLAYFCLDTAAIAFISNSRGLGRGPVNIAIIGMAAYVSLRTFSRAGSSMCIMILLLSLTTASRGIGAWILRAGIVAILFFFVVHTSWLDTIGKRSQAAAAFGGQVEERGYDRILADPQYVLLGAGEGEFKRFGGHLAEIGGELHSTLGTLLFGYGLPGLLLFLAFYFAVARRVRTWQELVVVLSPLAYGLTHNGLRASVTWIMLAFAVGCISRQPVARTASPSPSAALPMTRVEDAGLL
jgi:hypothetical protein